tara:strand:- start:4161 stop:4352 length:192 start_codon:yes stop_codon:yes gene_type:complete
MKKVKDLDHKLWLYEHLDNLNNNTQELMSGLLDGSIEIKDVSQFFLDYAEASEENHIFYSEVE